MGDELRGLPGKQEVFRGLVAPRPHRIKRWGAVERTVDLGARKLAGVPAEPIALAQSLEIEAPAPTVVGPAGSTDESLAHAVTRTRRRMLNNAPARQWLSPAAVRTKSRTMSRKAPSLTDFRRLVVKVGSSLLVDSDGGRLHDSWLSSLAEDIAKLHRNKRDVLVVSSGAISFGRAVLKLPAGPLKLEDSQAAAAVGQIALARTWSEMLGRHGITAGQVLVTLQDTEERRRYLNARSTIDKLLEWRAVPVVNENENVPAHKNHRRDNDRLAARVATMAGAHLLVLLSDVDCLYDAPPASKADAKHIPVVERITGKIEGMAGAAG